MIEAGAGTHCFFTGPSATAARVCAPDQGVRQLPSTRPNRSPPVPHGETDARDATRPGEHRSGHSSESTARTVNHLKCRDSGFVAIFHAETGAGFFWPPSTYVRRRGVLLPQHVNEYKYAQLHPQAYPAFTGGVSGPFLLDLRFPVHRLAAVRLGEAENFQHG